jgi:hypothetical protein
LALGFRSRDSAVIIATGYGLDGRGFGVRVTAGSRIFTSQYRLDRVCGSTQPPIHWVTGTLSPGVKRPVCEMATDLQLVPRSKTRGSMHQLRHSSAWRSA